MNWLARKYRSISASGFREIGIAAVVIAVTAFALITQGLRIHAELSNLTEAPTDNVQWEMAQNDVEILILLNALQQSMISGGSDLAEVRKRFDIFYSRIKTVSESAFLSNRPETEKLQSRVSAIIDRLEALIPIIDGNDAGLRASVPALMAEAEDIRAEVRAISLEFVQIFARNSDANRASLRVLFQETAVVGLLLIAALSSSILILFRQYTVSRDRARLIQINAERFASTINASLDAIIVSDEKGNVLDFNPSAEKMFGYSRNIAIGSRMADLIVPKAMRRAHSLGLERFVKTGQTHILKDGRVVITAMRANGEEFPVELSVGSTSGIDGRMIIGFVRDISDRVRAEDELRKTRDQALAAAHAKSNILAVMSHEMRTPLNGVLAVLDLLQLTDLDTRQKKFVHAAMVSGEILQMHVDDVLDLTRLQANMLPLRPEDFRLTELLEDVVSINRIPAELRGNSVMLIDELPACLLHADHNRIRQVMVNLVGNSVKFTSNGEIVIRARGVFASPELLNVSLVVSDTGIGIAESELDQIFEEFITIDASYSRTTPGTGLGLAISRRIARAMGGDVTVISTEGKGSEFTLSLPLPVKPDNSTTPAEVTTAVVPESRWNMRVLVAEDNDINRFVAAEMLARAGCTVEVALDGVEAVAAATSRQFDLIFMDLGMPNMDGLEATRIIKSSPDALSRKTPIIGLTAHAFAEDQDRLLAAGMEGFLFKPIRVNKLNTLLEEKFRHLRIDSRTAADEKTATHPVPLRTEELFDLPTISDLFGLLPMPVLSARIDQYCAELDMVGPKLSRLIDAGSAAEAGQLAHKYAGSAAVFGAIALRNRLIDIELAGQADRIADIKRILPDLGPLVMATRLQLQRFRKDGATMSVAGQE